MGECLFWSVLRSPVGPLELVSTPRGLAAIGFGKGELESWVRRTFPDASRAPAGKRHQAPADQLSQYFEKRRRVFDLPLDLRGTEFQKAIWNQVALVPFGRTVTYGEVAHLAGRPGAGRAVGAANGANPIPIIIPCHRVIGADGSLAGYGGGLEIKRWLLAHEAALRAESVQMRLFRPPASPA